MKRLNGKTAVVTGASSGIGRAIAERFIEEGAHVFITGRRKSELEQIAKELGAHATAVQADSSSLADLDRLFDVVKKSGKTIDILVANAGGGEFAPLGQISEEYFDKTFDINVKGVLFTVQKSLPLLKDGASVILTASNVANRGTPAFSVYSATKAAVRSFARGFTSDLQERRIRVNALSPGATSTPGLFGLVPEDQVEAFRNSMISTIPARRLAEPREIADTAVFLASDESRYITGTDIIVDGGASQV